jgi:lysophospholipase L1-like esterase
MRRFSSAVVAATFIASMVQAGVPAARAESGASVTYLALGDSLAAGYQPGKGETTHGYADDLRRRLRQQIPGLSLQNLACPGETSLSMITGHSPCRYAAGSQLDAAISFLEAHPGQVAFITIDIGSNDLVKRCFGPSGVIDGTCAAGILPRLQARVTHIVDALSTAAGAGVPIVGMTYYDPFLGFWGLLPGGHHVARADLRAWEVMNAGLTTAYGDAGASVADVAATFRIDDFTDTVVVPGRGRLPVNVALTCKWTWFCSTKFLGDEHANRSGDRKIGRTFRRELRTLLS